MKLRFKKHPVGDISLVLTDYVRGDSGIILSQPFIDAVEVQKEFGKLERLVADAKRKALKMVER